MVEDHRIEDIEVPQQQSDGPKINLNSLKMADKDLSQWIVEAHPELLDVQLQHFMKMRQSEKGLALGREQEINDADSPKKSLAINQDKVDDQLNVGCPETQMILEPERPPQEIPESQNNLILQHPPNQNTTDVHFNLENANGSEPPLSPSCFLQHPQFTQKSKETFFEIQETPEFHAVKQRSPLKMLERLQRSPVRFFEMPDQSPLDRDRKFLDHSALFGKNTKKRVKQLRICKFFEKKQKIIKSTKKNKLKIDEIFSQADDLNETQTKALSSNKQSSSVHFVKSMNGQSFFKKVSPFEV